MGSEPQPPPRGEDPATSSSGAGGEELPRATLEGVRRRDPAALAELFDRHVDRIFALAYRMTGDRSVAEDVTQEVFLRVHRSAHQLDPARQPGPWLMAITANLCREWWRGRRRRQRTRSLDAEPGLIESVPAAGPDPEREAARRDRDERIMEAILLLPHTLRLVVVLHDFEGLTHEEIAAVVEARPPAVRKRYSRALAMLRDLLEDVVT